MAGSAALDASPSRATASRVRTLNEHKEELLAHRVVTKELLAEYLPSVSTIKVVKESEDSYIAYEGNGRLAAMQQVFDPADAIEIEVQQYNFRNPKKIIRHMNTVRKMNGLI